jgi:hypothetical protein
MNVQENLDPKILPDLVSQAVPKEKAADMLYQALRKQAKLMGFDPDTEVSMTKKSGDYPEEIEKEDIWVTFEAGPWEWGVAYSLSSHPGFFWPEIRESLRLGTQKHARPHAIGRKNWCGGVKGRKRTQKYRQ